MKVMFVIVNPVFMLLVTVTVLAALLVPTVTVPKARAVGVTDTGICPVPVSDIVCGLLGALSVMVTLPLDSPAAVGVNFTVMVQVPPAATLVPQVLTWL